MRLTILKEDTYIAIDGVAFHHADLSRLPEDFHALQWYDDHGEIEWLQPHPHKKLMRGNEEITSLEGYEWVIDEWTAAKNRNEAAMAASLSGATPDEINKILGM